MWRVMGLYMKMRHKEGSQHGRGERRGVGGKEGMLSSTERRSFLRLGYATFGLKIYSFGSQMKVKEPTSTLAPLESRDHLFLTEGGREERTKAHLGLLSFREREGCVRGRLSTTSGVLVRVGGGVYGSVRVPSRGQGVERERKAG